MGNSIEGRIRWFRVQHFNRIRKLCTEQYTTRTQVEAILQQLLHKTPTGRLGRSASAAGLTCRGFTFCTPIALAIRSERSWSTAAKTATEGRSMYHGLGLGSFIDLRCLALISAFLQLPRWPAIFETKCSLSTSLKTFLQSARGCLKSTGSVDKY